MGLLDFDDDKILATRRLRTSGQYQLGKREYEPEPNFSELQDIGRKENSKDFEDSPFADRKPI